MGRLPRLVSTQHPAPMHCLNMYMLYRFLGEASLSPKKESSLHLKEAPRKMRAPLTLSSWNSPSYLEPFTATSVPNPWRRLSFHVPMYLRKGATRRARLRS
jgi:hypothetical protein